MPAAWERVADNLGGTIAGLTTVQMAGRSLVFAVSSVGVFRSTDAGRRWQQAADRNPVPFAMAVAASARFEHDRTLFVGAADGLFRSSDGGDTWQAVLVGSGVPSVASALVDGRDANNQVLLAGTETDGVLRSDDAGRTWTGANVGLPDLIALALAVSPQFASDRTGFVGTASGLYRTRNGARSWREVESGLPASAVQCLAMSPTFADDRLVLAGTEADGLLRSEDAGATWHRPAPLVGEGVTAIAFSTFYPSKPTVAAATQSGIARSDDGGRTWRRMITSLPGLVLSLAFVSAGADEVLLAGLQRHGIFRSDDDAASWEVSNTGLRAKPLTGLVLSPAFRQDRTIFVTGPQDGLRMSMDGGQTWMERTAGLAEPSVLSLALSPDYAADQTLYAATAEGIQVSHDAAATWHASADASASATIVATPAAPAEDGGETAVVAALSDGRLLASGDGGLSWRELTLGCEDLEISSLSLATGHGRDQTLFVATVVTRSVDADDAVLWRSLDGGERWERWFAERQVRGRRRLLALAVSPGYASDDVVFVGLDARVLKSVRHAQVVRTGQRRPVWRAVHLSEEVATVTAVAPSPDYTRDQTVFAGTNAGVHVSRDGGHSYQLWSDGLVPPGILALAVSPDYSSDRLVYALGLGGTLWRRLDR